MVLVIGHRGAPVHAPENTLAGFEEAIRLGARALELDVRSCREPGVVIVHHDSALGRSTSGSGRLKKMSVDQIKAVDAGNGEKIPLLSEVFEQFAGRVPLLIEIKSRAVAPDVAALILEYIHTKECRYDDFIVICFYMDVLETIHEIDRQILTGANVAPEGRLKDSEKVGAFYCGEGREADDVAEICADYHWLHSVNPHRSLISEEVVRRLKASHKKVYTWTVNEESEVKRVVEAGVDGVMSDDPMMVKKSL